MIYYRSSLESFLNSWKELSIALFISDLEFLSMPILETCGSLIINMVNKTEAAAVRPWEIQLLLKYWVFVFELMLSMLLVSLLMAALKIPYL